MVCFGLAFWQYRRHQEKSAYKAQLDARREHVLHNADLL
jgi:cytochrome oxidase assembly protein ShyY1